MCYQLEGVSKGYLLAVLSSAARPGPPPRLLAESFLHTWNPQKGAVVLGKGSRLRRILTLAGEASRYGDMT